MNICQSQMTRTLGSPKIIQSASHRSTGVYHAPHTLLGSPGIQDRGSLCPQAISLPLSEDSRRLCRKGCAWTSFLWQQRKRSWELQDGGGVRRGDRLPPHKYIRNTSTCGTTPTEHLLNAGRRTQTSKKARNSPRTWVSQKEKNKYCMLTHIYGI